MGIIFYSKAVFASSLDYQDCIRFVRNCKYKLRVRLSTFEMMKGLQSEDLIPIEGDDLRNLQLEVLSVAKDVACVCREYGLTYSLGGGSALGAVRHKGFIPWDDDMDIDMPRKDFMKFVELFPSTLGNKYWLHVPGQTENYGLLIAHVRKKGTKLRAYNDQPEECGVPIDIFIIENTYDNMVLRMLHGLISQFLGLMVSCRRFYQDKDSYLGFASGNKQTLQSIKLKAFIGKLASFLSLRKWTHIADRWNARCADDSSRYVTVPGGRHHYFGEMRARSMFGNRKMLTFEGEEWPVPEMIDEYLSKHYEDYMTLPDEADREKHAYLEVEF